MKVTKSQLKKIIQEELERADVDTKEKMHPGAVLKELEKVIAVAKMNKSFGFSSKATKAVHDELSKLLTHLDWSDMTSPFKKDSK